MNPSSQKSKEKHNRRCNSFFGINLDRESAFLETGHLNDFISSQLSDRVLSPKSDNTETEDAPKRPIDITKEVSFLEEYNEGSVKPIEIVLNDFIDPRTLGPLKVSTPRVRDMKKLVMDESTTPHSSRDEILLHLSPSSFLQDCYCHSSTPLSSISKGNVRNGEKMRNYGQSVHTSVSRRLYKSPNRNYSVRKSSMSLELYQKDSEKCRSPLKVLPLNKTSQNTEIVLDKEIDYKLVENSFSVMEKYCSSGRLPNQNPTLTTGIGKSPGGKCSANWSDMNMVSKYVSNTTINESTIPEKDSSSNKDGVYTAANEELISSLCNMSINQESSLADIKDDTYTNLIIIDEVYDSCDSSKILHEASDLKCRTPIKHEGESYNSVDSEACNNLTKEEPPPPIERVHASTSKFEDGVEPVKVYMLPFVSNDPQENKDNEDPQWHILAKLETDEERYQFTRKLWKSIVVPDPNVDMTYYGCLRRRRAQRNASQEVSHVRGTVLSQKRKSRPDGDVGQPPKKRARGVMDVNFSVRRLEESMKAVKLDFMEESSRSNLSHQQLWKLERTYQEKIQHLIMACSEVEAIHKFYHGLPDQDMSVSQASVEAEQLEIEKLYERFKKMYGWDGRAFIP